MTESTQELNELVQYLTKRVEGAEAMLVFVLQEVGKPVVIPKDRVQAGIPEEVMVDIDSRTDPSAFIFSIKEDRDTSV